MSTHQEGRLSQSTAMSIGLVALLLTSVVGSAVWITSETSAVRETLVRQVGEIRADVRVVAEQVSGLRGDMIARPTMVEVRAMIVEAVRAHEAEVSSIAKDIEARLRILEQKQ